MGFLDRLQHGWNAFMNKDPTIEYRDYGVSYSSRPDRIRLTRGNERSIVTAIYNRIAMDVATITIKHCKLDENGRYLEDINSSLNSCLNLEANKDQTGRAFIQDAVMSMLDEGVVALVPVDTDINPMDTSSFGILSMRTAKVIEWYPSHVKVRLYNDRTGNKEDITLPKEKVSIIENPLYAIINEPNSTMQRLIRKLSLLDIVDEQSSAGKLDLIIQLPYVIKSEARRQQADARRKDIEMQLAGSKYGIAYTDGTERITQLNRPLENNLLKQIEYLTSMLYSQLGFHQTILDGTADEKTMLNYNNRIVEPIISAIVDEMKRKFLTKTARTQNQTILFFRDPFKLVPVNDIAEIADKFTRNEIMTSNEIRQIVGMKPSNDPKADELRNSNINHEGREDPMIQHPGLQEQGIQELGPQGTMGQEPEEQNILDQPLPKQQSRMTESEWNEKMDQLDELDEQLDELENLAPDKDMKHYASPYYDPVKAHEYYMKNRELKGRRSTAGLNEEGQSIAKYVKEQIDAEKKQKSTDLQNQTNSRTKAISEDTASKVKANTESMTNDINSKKENMTKSIEQHAKNVENKLESLRKKLKDMTYEEWIDNADGVMKEIEGLRDSNSAMREKLQSEYSEYAANRRESTNKANTSLQEQSSKSIASIKEEHTKNKANLDAEYEEKYLSELDKLKSNSAYVTKKKTSTKKKSTTKSSTKSSATSTTSK